MFSKYVHMAHCNRSSLAWIGGKLDGKTFTNALLDIYSVASYVAATIVSVCSELSTELYIYGLIVAIGSVFRTSLIRG